MNNTLKSLTEKQVGYIFYGLLFCVVWLMYGLTIGHEYNLDDAYYIQILPEEGTGIKQLFAVFQEWFGKSNYRPLPAFHLALEQLIFGRSPHVFHFFNVLYYSVLGVFLFYILKKLKLFEKQWVIFLVVLFFLVHPSHANVVSSIKNRDVILSMLYGLGFTLSVINFQEKRRLYLIPLSVFYLAASMLCKIDGVLFVPVTGVLLYFLRGVRLKKLLIPLFVLLLLAVAFYVFSTAFFVPEPEVKAKTELWENPMKQVNFIYGLIFNTGLTYNYHKFMVIPKDYFFYYGYNQVKIPDLLSPTIIISFFSHIAILFAALIHVFRGKRNKLMMSVIIYFLFLLPFIILMHTVAGIIAVRYSFNASLGFSIFVLSIYWWAYTKFNTIKFAKYTLVAAFTVLCLFFTYLSFDRSLDWKNKETLFTHDLERLTDSYMANRMGGIYFYNLAIYEGASEQYKRKNAIKARNYLFAAQEINAQDPVLWHYIGKVNMQNENFKDAYFNFKHAISLDSTNVQSWMAYGEFCIFANDSKRTEEAFRNVLNLDSDNTVAYENLIYALVNQSKIEEAIKIGEGMIIYPEIATEGYEYLGNIYWALKDTAKTIENYTQSVNRGNQKQGVIEFLNHFDSTNQ